LLGDLLQIVVDGELNLLAGNRFLFGKVPKIFDFFADAVDDHAAHTVGARQDVVVLALETGFSGEVAGAKSAITGFDLLLADFANVSAGVRHEAARKIATSLDHEHFEEGDVEKVRFDEGHVCVVGFRLDNDGLELRKVFGGFQLVLQITDRDAQAFGDSRETFVDQSGIVAEKQDTERRIVVHQDAAIAVQHTAARSDDGNGTNAIALGHLTVLIGVDDLEFPETEEQQTDHAHDDVGGDGQSGLWQTIVVAKPVRHEDPAREPLFYGCQAADTLIGAVRRPSREWAGTCSRHEKSAANVCRKLSSERNNSKNSLGVPESLPDLCFVRAPKSF